MRYTLVMLLLGGCSTHHALPAVDCPLPVPVPLAAPRYPTREQIEQLEIRVELARERERARGDRCAEAVGVLQTWIERRK